MKKFIAGLVAGLSVLALTLITVLLDPHEFLKPPWTIISRSLGLCALVSMVLQGLWIKQDDDTQARERQAERKERERLYALVKKILEKLSRRRSYRTEDSHRRRVELGLADSLVEHLNKSDPGSTYPDVDEMVWNHLYQRGFKSNREWGTKRDRAIDELEFIVLDELDQEDDGG
jgi:hypothetical protein